MDRDWDAEWAVIEDEYRSARQAIDVASLPMSSSQDGVPPTMSSEALTVYRQAYRRFLDATERRSSFFLERARCEPR